MDCRIMRSQRAKGVAIVEMAVVVVLLLMLTFGIVEYGWLMLKAQEVTNCARHAARVGARPASSNEDVLAAVDSLMSAAGMSGNQVSLDGDVSQVEPGDVLTVTVTVPYSTPALRI